MIPITVPYSVLFYNLITLLFLVYVDASDACNDLNFLLGDTAATGTTLASRSWSVRVTQYECGSQLLAPPGCTQYFYGDSTGSFQSYNYQGNYHLANQNQNICMRRERGNCRICYSAPTVDDFQVSGGIYVQLATYH